MSGWPRAWVTALPLVCAVAVGCATPAGRYLSRRGRDLGDCIEAEAGVGWPLAPVLFPRVWNPAARRGVGGGGPGPRYWLLPRLYVRAKATDFLVLGDGVTEPVRMGWRGRYRPAGLEASLASGCPLYANHEEIGGTTVHTRFFMLTRRTYDERAPGPRGRVAERFWTGVAATLLVSLRLEINPAELGDFLVGWAGWDLLKDDEWTPRLQAADRRKIEDEDDGEDEHEKR